MMVWDAIKRFFVHICGSLCAVFAFVTFSKEVPIPDPEAGVTVVPIPDDSDSIEKCDIIISQKTRSSFETVQFDASKKYMRHNNFFVPADVVEYTSTGRIRPKRRLLPDDKYTQFVPKGRRRPIRDLLDQFPIAPNHIPAHLNMPVAIEGEDQNAVLLKYLQGLADDGPYPASVISSASSSKSFWSAASASGSRGSRSSYTSKTAEQDKAIQSLVFKQLKRASLTAGYGQTTPAPLPAYVTEGLAARTSIRSISKAAPPRAESPAPAVVAPAPAPVNAPVVAPVRPVPPPVLHDDHDVPWTETDEGLLAFRASVVSFRSSGSDYHAVADARDQLILDLDLGIPRQPPTPCSERRRSVLGQEEFLARIAQPTQPLRIIKKNQAKVSPLAIAPVIHAESHVEEKSTAEDSTPVVDSGSEDDVVGQPVCSDTREFQKSWDQEVKDALRQFQEAEATDESFSDIFYANTFVSQSTVLYDNTGRIRNTVRDDETCTDNGSDSSDITPQLQPCEDSFETTEPTADDSVLFEMLEDDDDGALATPDMESVPIVAIAEDQTSTDEDYPTLVEALPVHAHGSTVKMSDVVGKCEDITLPALGSFSSPACPDQTVVLHVTWAPAAEHGATAQPTQNHPYDSDRSINV